MNDRYLVMTRLLRNSSAIMFFVRDVRHQYQTTQVPKKEIGDKQMKKLLGIIFLLAVATVVYFGSVGWPSLDINLWSLIPVGLFLFFHSRESFEKGLQG